MNEKDDILLEYLADTGAAQPPKVIHWNITRDGPDFVIKTLRRRLNRLDELGLVRVARETGKYYEITDDGHAYLAGELDASTLED